MRLRLLQQRTVPNSNFRQKHRCGKLLLIIGNGGGEVKEENNRVCLKVEAVYTHLLEAYSSLRYL